MNAVRWIVFGALLAVFVLFAIPNWTVVQVNLGTTLLDIRLPLLVLAGFVIGWLPTILMHWTARATWRRRTAKVDRMLEDALSTGPRTAPSPVLAPYPVQAQPTIVPPGA
jgi:putative membrane protein